MTYQYKIRSADTAKGTFVIEFNGLQPLSYWIPHNETGFLTGAELEAAIQNMYPWGVQQEQKFKTFTNGSDIEALIEAAPTPAQTEEQIRQQRNVLLARSDWTQLPDAQLTTEQKAEWATYRQALRDVTTQAGFPGTIDWPVAP
jgi:hypothetical protein